jgi:hypothetical protein
MCSDQAIPLCARQNKHLRSNFSQLILLLLVNVFRHVFRRLRPRVGLANFRH